MSECKIPFFHSGIYKRKINKVILPPNLQTAQQMQCIKGRQREGPSSPPGLRSFSLVAENQELQQGHRGYPLTCWSLGRIPEDPQTPHPTSAPPIPCALSRTVLPVNQQGGVYVCVKGIPLSRPAEDQRKESGLLYQPPTAAEGGLPPNTPQ